MKTQTAFAALRGGVTIHHLRKQSRFATRIIIWIFRDGVRWAEGKLAMTKVSLYDLPRPVLIVKKPTGIIYYNQVGGCGCYHKEQEGYIIPLWGIDPMDHRTFNHHVWYAHPFGSSSPDLSKMWTDQELRNLGDEQKRLWKCHMWWEEVIEDIEFFTERDVGARGFVRMKVKKDEKHHEAWVQVRALLFTKEQDWSRILKKGRHRSESKEWVDAVLTWQNCD
jgi:hypothetical protein